MPILKNIFPLFARKKPEETVAGVTPPEPSIAPALAAITPPDNVIYIYSHGFTNGIYKIEPDKDSFERFLEYSNLLDRIKDQLELKEKAIAEMDLKLNSAMNVYAADTNTFIEKEKLAGNVSVSLTELDQLRIQKGHKQTGLITQMKETVSEYAWVPALLYFAAGATFIMADISITKQITSWGFNMTGWQSWIFAIGLAFTAFLIKPTVDRLLEKPFQAGGFKLKTVYKCVLLGIAVIGIIMLYFLGKFRSDSEIARNDLAELSTRMNVLDPNSQQYKTCQDQYDAIQKGLDQNFMGQTGLILSGMLFAVGGAICLSVSFGSLKQLITRYWILPVRIQRVKKEIKMLAQQCAALRSEHTTLKIDQEKAEKRLSANEIPLLKDELKNLQEERSALIAKLYQAQYEKERALYLDGKNKGGKYAIEGELLYKVSNNDHSSPYLGKQDSDSGTQSTSPTRPYTRRPFVKMRKMIADNFNKNQTNQTYDGTEFEIMS
jgi:hypothetical protein